MKPKLWKNKKEDFLELIWCLGLNEFSIPSGGTVTNFVWHREDGPAYKYITTNITYIEYWQNNMLHSYSKPALNNYNRLDRTTSRHWRIWGNQVDGEEYLQWISDMGMDIKNLTPEDKILIDLKWVTE